MSEKAIAKRTLYWKIYCPKCEAGYRWENVPPPKTMKCDVCNTEFDIVTEANE